MWKLNFSLMICFLFGINKIMSYNFVQIKMKQIEKIQVQFSIIWDEFAKKYEYDPQLGYLISEQHEIKCFDITPLKQTLDILPQLNETGKIIQIAESFKPIVVTEPLNFKDMVILHDTTAMIVQSYYIEKIKSINPSQVRIPGNLAQLLYLSSQYLKCNYGNITVYPYNWKIKQNRYKTDPLNLTYEDVQLKWFFTKQKSEQANFFVLNFLGSFYMWKIFKSLFYANFLVKKAPWLETQIISQLNQTSTYWEKVVEQNTKMISMMENYFYFNLRPYIAGFQQVYFQKVDKKLSASRGNTGFDPSYQLCQETMGISFKVHNPGFQALRVMMRKVMAKVHSQSIEDIEKLAQLRNYCMLSQELTEAYNRLLEHEIKFTKLHNQFVMKYIKQFSPHIQSQSPFKELLGKQNALQKNILRRKPENTNLDKDQK